MKIYNPSLATFYELFHKVWQVCTIIALSVELLPGSVLRAAFFQLIFTAAAIYLKRL